MTTGEGGIDTAASSALPAAEEFKTAAPAEGDGDRNGVFEALVTGDSDIVGLVAYSIYKQNKHDWLIAFARSKGRDPNEVELAAYIVGESTPRRLATYRHLAESTLEGRGPDVPSSAAEGAARSVAVASRQRSAGPAQTSSGNGTLLAFAALVVVGAVAVYLAARFGIPGVSR